MNHDTEMLQVALTVLDRHVLERAIRLLVATGPLSTWETDAASRLLETMKPGI